MPVSLALFSGSTITQFELEQIQAAVTPTQQTQTLLSFCLKKGEVACRSFYTALRDEDELLAEDINGRKVVTWLTLKDLRIHPFIRFSDQYDGGAVPEL